MGPLGLVVRRARAGAGLLTTILLLSAATIGIIAGTLGYGQAAATVAARQALTSGPPTESGIQVQTRVADDIATQDATARRLIAESFAPATISLQHTLVSETRRLHETDQQVVAWASDSLMPGDAGFADLVEVVEGTWPTSEGDQVQAALPTADLEAAGVGVGDVVTIDDVEVQIVALWRPIDTTDAFWFDDPLISAPGEGEIGPLVVASEHITDFGGTPFNRWTVQPDSERINPDDMPMLAGAAAGLQRDLSHSEIDVRGVTVDGDLGPTTASAAHNLATAQALGVVPIVLLLLVSVIAVVQIARLQANARSGEVELFVARGASRRQVLGWTLIEAIVVTLLATALGIAAAIGVLQFVPGGDTQGQTVLRGGVLTGVAVLAALALIALLQARRVGVGADRSGRTRQVAALGTLVLTLAAAGLTWWQLRQYGSPLVTEDDGSLSTDLLAGAAPALLLAAGAVVAMALLGPTGRMLEGATRRTRGMVAHLATGQVSRRLVVYAVPVVLTILAVGTTTVSAMYAGTSAQLRDRLAAVGQGPEVRATLSPGPVTTSEGVITVPALTDVAGVHTWAPVWNNTARVGGTEIVLTVAPVADLGELTDIPADVLNPDTLSADLVDISEIDIVPLPDGTSGLTFEVSMTTEVDQPTVDMLNNNLETNREHAIEVGLSEEQIEEDFANYGLQDRWVDLEFVIAPIIRDPETGLSSELPGESMTFTGGQVRLVGSAMEGVIESMGTSTTEATITVPIPEGLTGELTGLRLGFGQPGNLYNADLTIESMTAEGGDENLLAGLDLDSWGDLTQAQGGQGINASDEAQYLFDADRGAFDISLITGVYANSGDAPPEFLTLGHVPAYLEGGQVSGPADDDDDAATAAEGAPAIPVAITPGLASANNLAVGDELTLPLLGGASNVVIAAIVPAVPGTLSPTAVLADSTTVASSFAARGTPLPVPQELWAGSTDPDASVAAISTLPRVTGVTGPGAVSVTDAASAVRMVFWVASAGAVLLALTGIGAVAATLVAVRRPEVAVLRALGMTPGSQARSRAAELLTVVAAAIVVGLGAGWLVSSLVIPELASSTTLGGQVSLPAVLRLEPPLWFGLLGVLIAAVVLLVFAFASRVRTQALDNEYREEIR